MHKPNLAHIALINPTLGFILDVLKPRLVPRVYRLIQVFNNLSVVEQSYPVNMDETFVTDAWLYEAEYSIHAPNAHAGSAFKSLNDVNMELKPYVMLKLRLDGLGPGCDYPIVDRYTPIEHCAKASVSPAPYSGGIGDTILIRKRQLLKADFMLNRALNVDEVPYIVSLAFKTYQVDDCSMCNFVDKDIQDWRQQFLGSQGMGLQNGRAQASGVQPGASSGRAASPQGSVPTGRTFG